MRRLLPLLALSAALTATGATASPMICTAGLHRATTAELFFGRNIADNGVVSEADWGQFVDAEVTPRFPDGLSVNDVYGQWRNPTGGFVREQSKALFLVLNGAPDDRAKLELVRNAYKARFHQDSVMLVEQQACVGF
ncbi:MAG TPA: DUF3574 domain-containing protein [Caulobacteraceae bacterium]|jgi:hypothetical protein|nr:DUF3574 domain-containing protein [Caulobacteraceae bacterium]